MFNMNDIMAKKTHDNKLNNHLLNIEKKLPKFFILKFASILFVMHFCIIKCNFDVLNLSIFITYDVQYVVITCRFKIN
jgi:hypothetical protein